MSISFLLGTMLAIFGMPSQRISGDKPPGQSVIEDLGNDMLRRHPVIGKTRAQISEELGNPNDFNDLDFPIKSRELWDYALIEIRFEGDTCVDAHPRVTEVFWH